MSDQNEGEPNGTFRFRKQRPTDVLARRVRELRTRQGMSAQKLADRCAEAGMPQLNRAIISTIETGRRQDVSLEETLILAHALNVAPIHLFVPLDEEAMQVGRWTVGSGRVRAWVRGQHPLLSVTDERFYATEVPDEEWQPPSRATAHETLEGLRRMAQELGVTYVMKNDETGERIEGGPSGERRIDGGRGE